MNPEPSSAGRDASLLASVAESLEQLFRATDFDPVIPAILERTGRALRTQRVTVIPLPASTSSAAPLKECCGWSDPSVDMPCCGESTLPDAAAFRSRLAAGPFRGPVSETEEPFPICLPGAKAVLAVPITIGGEFWGAICVEDLQAPREWTAGETQALTALASALGGALARRESEDFLKEQAAELKRHRNVALSLIEDARLAEKAADQASESKSRFLAMMSHEIRTPLNGVIGFTDLLLAEGLPERQSEMAEAIRTCGQSLLILISDILDISKIESDHLRLDPTNGDVVDFVRSVMATFEPAAIKAGITLSLEPEENFHRIWRLDFPRLRQIIFNLVGNAVKFAPGGLIGLRISALDKESPLRLRFAVSDTGSGISSDDQLSVFEPFFQGEGARKAVAGGSGLGLSICRKLVEAMGGTIQVTSAPGQGTCFTFEIRAEKIASDSAVVSSTESLSASEPAAPRHLKVLVVDDVEMNLRLAVSLLARLGYTAEVAHNGAEALRKSSEVTYDVIFMDILMPEIDGLETTRNIQAQCAETGRPIPWIVALTADALTESRERCLAAGMKDFLTKPLRLKDMEEAFRRCESALQGPPR